MRPRHASPSDAVTRPRKVRKGTRSCWNCRKRKQKCVFDSPSATACVICQERGTKCVSQALPDEAEESHPIPRGLKLGNRVKRVESLVDKLLDSGDSRLQSPSPHWVGSRGDSHAGQALRTPESSSLESPRTSEPYSQPLNSNSRWLSTSEELCAALPSRHDLEILCQPGALGVPSFHALFTVPYTAIDKHGLPSVSTFLEVPGPDTHPLLIARYMLRLALYLQYPRHDLMCRPEIPSLSEPLSTITDRLISVVRDKVTTRDDTSGSIEGLECLFLETQCDLHHGNLRRSWMTNRKTIAMAQLMGLDRAGSSRNFLFLDPENRSDPRFMWFRMILNDRHLCLMLGLSQASYDRTMAEDGAFAVDTPEGQLERLHCVLQSQILERHESRNRPPSSTSSTENLDLQLQNLAARMPSTWWLLPNFANTTFDPEGLFGEIRRLILHLNHYHLVLQLHIPYISRSRSTGDNEESRATCIIAAREILSRFLILRTSRNIGFGCRNADFFALTAAMAMILIYIEEHQATRKKKNRGHQYLSDRGMMERAQQNMEALGQASKDPFSTQSAELMGKLLAIEGQAAAGQDGCADRVSMSSKEAELIEGERIGFSLNLPLFGKIRIAPEGVSREPTHPHVARGAMLSQSELRGEDIETPLAMPAYATPAPSQHAFDARAIWNPTLTESPSMGFLAGIDDWALQGVDTAFFSNLLSSDLNFGQDTLP